MILPVNLRTNIKATAPFFTMFDYNKTLFKGKKLFEKKENYCWNGKKKNLINYSFFSNFTKVCFKIFFLKGCKFPDHSLLPPEKKLQQTMRNKHFCKVYMYIINMNYYMKNEYICINILQKGGLLFTKFCLLS